MSFQVLCRLSNLKFSKRLSVKSFGQCVVLRPISTLMAANPSNAQLSRTYNNPQSFIQQRFARTKKIPSLKKIVKVSESDDSNATDEIEQLKETSSSSRRPVVTNKQLEEGGINEDIWAWVPPRDQLAKHQDQVKSTYQIPVLKKVLLTTDEVKQYLESNGATDVIVLPLKQPLENIRHFVIASATSTRLVRQLGETIARALKARELNHVMGSTGVEGARDDDWQLVDCHEFLVQLMLPETRKVIDLESHWSMEERPYVPFSKSEEEYERHFRKLLDQYPAKEINLSIGNDVPLEDEVEERSIKVL